MNIFNELGYIYDEIDNRYSIIEVESRSLGYNRREAEYFQKRRLNDQAYFLFMFTRLEDRVRELTDNLINEKVAGLTNWKYKRTWEIINKLKSEDRLHFMNRVALLTKRGNADYNLINNYYNQRNNIAHGRTFTVPINIQTVIRDMNRLFNDLKE